MDVVTSVLTHQLHGGEHEQPDWSFLWALEHGQAPHSFLQSQRFSFSLVNAGFWDIHTTDIWTLLSGAVPCFVGL